MHKYEEKTLSSKKIFEGKVISLQVDDVSLPNGETSKREIVKHPGAVAVIALTDEKKLVLVDQYRKPLERSLYEIPAGKLEKGENPEASAMRELEEETGYSCQSLEHVVSFYTSPGFANELIHLYVARDLEKQANPLTADEDEFVDVIEVSVEEAEKLIATEHIYDAKTVYAVQYLLLKQMKEQLNVDN